MELEDVVRKTEEIYISKQTFGLYSQILDREINNLRQDVDFIYDSVGVSKESKEFNNSLNLLGDVLGDVNNTLKSVAGFFLSSLKDRQEQQYLLEERRMEAVQEQAAPITTITAKPKEEEKKGTGDTISSILKTLLKNPLVIAGLTTAIAQFLPQDIKDNFNAFFKGFFKKIEEVVLNIKEFNIGTAAAGAALALLAGPKLIGWALGAVTGTLRLLKALGVGKLFTGKMGKLLLGGLVVGGAAVAINKYLGKDEDTPEPEAKGEGGGVMGSVKEVAKSAGNVVAGALGMSSMAPETTTVAPKGEKSTTRSIAPTNEPKTAIFSSEDKKLNGSKSYLRVMPGVDIDNLQPAVKSRLQDMSKEYYEKTGKKLQVNSGFRSYEKQKALYEQYGPGRASRPGTSRHETGLAFDIQSTDAKKLIELGLLDKYGFHRPYSKETWHVEPKELITNLAGADNPNKPGAPIASTDKGGNAIKASTGEKISLSSPNYGYIPGGSPSATSASGRLSAPGADIEKMSVDNDATRATTKIIDPSISSSSSTQTGSMPASRPPMAIPSPSADRGSLNFRTFYSAG